MFLGYIQFEKCSYLLLWKLHIYKMASFYQPNIQRGELFEVFDTSTFYSVMVFLSGLLTQNLHQMLPSSQVLNSYKEIRTFKQTTGEKPLLVVTASGRLLYGETSRLHCSGAILDYSPTQTVFTARRFGGRFSFISSLHRYSIGFKSGDWLGHWIVSLSLSLCSLLKCPGTNTFTGKKCWRIEYLFSPLSIY